MRSLVFLITLILSACAPQATPLSTSITANDDCSPSNPAIANWLRETEPADTLSLSALQTAADLYSNPSDTGKEEALDWQERTIQAYDFMKEYQPVPECVVAYHNLVTETLYQLSVVFSELELAYVAMGANQEYKTHVDAAREHLSAAHEASQASVDEWNKLEELSSVSREASDSISTPTHLPSPDATSDSMACDKDLTNSYLADVDIAMRKVNQLAADFGQTQNREQAEEIVDELDILFQEIALWETSDCASEVQVNLLLVIQNLVSAQRALLNGDMEGFNREYETYEVALNQLNDEVANLEELAK